MNGKSLVSTRLYVFAQNAVRIVLLEDRQHRLHSPSGESNSQAQRKPSLFATASDPAAAREGEVVGKRFVKVLVHECLKTHWARSGIRKAASSCVIGMLILAVMLTTAVATAQGPPTQTTDNAADALESASSKTNPQETSRDQTGRETFAADRFLQILRQRPAPGTALDRLYGYHVQAGTLNQLLEQLANEKITDEEKSGKRFLLLGLLYQRSDDDQLAVGAFSEAETRLPDWSRPSFLAAKSLLVLGKTKDAIAALERSLDRNPQRIEAIAIFKELGRVYHRLGKRDEALEVWRRLEETFPGDRRVSEQIARTLAADGDAAAALERFEKLAVEAKPENPAQAIDYRITAADLKSRMGRNDDALADYESLLTKIRPNSWLYADVRRRIEDVFLRSGDIVSLADYYVQRVKNEPDNIQLRMNLARVQTQAGQFKAAELTLSDARQIAPNDRQVQLALINVLQQSGQTHEVVLQLQSLVERFPEQTDDHVRLGHAWLQDTSIDLDQRRDAAQAAWQRFADLRRDDPVITAQIADLMRRIDRNENAIALYRRAIAKAPDQARYREYLGEIFDALGRRKEAEATWMKIADDPRYTRDNLIHLAEILNRFGRHEKALAAFSKAIKLDPTFAQRLRFVSMLAKHARYPTALQQLDAAKASAKSDSEQDHWLDAWINVLIAKGTLNQQIDVAQELADRSGVADDYRKLARMMRAANQVGFAIDAIETALTKDDADVRVLQLAGDLYRDANRNMDAIDIYRQLAERDKRYRPSLFRRISMLHQELGHAAESIAAAKELVAATPNNPESVRFCAQQCFAFNRIGEGIEQLRTALRRAPGDGETRSLLAKALRENLKFEEAIELYWQMLQDEDRLADQIPIVETLALIYQQQSHLGSMMQRLESFTRKRSDLRSGVLLTAQAHLATGDYQAARTSLRSLLANNENDLELLKQLVRLSIESNDLSTAIEYQRKLLHADETLDHRRRLIELLTEAGEMTEANEVALGMANGRNITEDPAAVVFAIDSAIESRQNDAAVELCRNALRLRGDLWEIRARLAYVLCNQRKFTAALEQAQRISELNLRQDEPSHWSQSQFAKTDGNTFDRSANPLAYQVAINKALVADARPQNTTARASEITIPALQLHTFGQAKYLALMIKLAEADRLGKFDSVAGAMVDLTNLSKLDNLDDIRLASEIFAIKRLLQTRKYVMQLSGSLSSSHFLYLNRLDRMRSADYQKCLWRWADLDEPNRVNIVRKLIASRSVSSPAQSSNRQVEPLSHEQVDIAIKAYADASQSLRPSELREFAADLHAVLKQSGRIVQAESLVISMTQDSHAPSLAIDALDFASRLNDDQSCTSLITRVEEHLPQWAATLTAFQCRDLIDAVLNTKLLGLLATSDKHRAVELATALRAIAATKTNHHAIANQSGTGFPTRRARNPRVPIDPHSYSLLPRSDAHKIYRMLRFDNPSLDLSRLLNRLTYGPGLLVDDARFCDKERIMRAALAVYGFRSLDANMNAYDASKHIRAEFPDDADVALQHALLAAGVWRQSEALDTLDSIDSINPNIIRQRDLAIIHIAIQANQHDRALVAAKRLATADIDHNEAILVWEQLVRGGETQLARSLLQRLHSKQTLSADQHMQVAWHFLTLGDDQSASKIAIDILDNQSQYPSKYSSTHQKDAIQILKQSKRLSTFVEQAEQRALASPNSFSINNQLAQLYRILDRDEEANEIIKRLLSRHPGASARQWQMAKNFAKANRHNEAAQCFLSAAGVQPELINRDFRDFVQTLHTAGQHVATYELLLKIDLAKLDSNVILHFSNGTWLRAAKEDADQKQRLLTAFSSRAAGMVKIQTLRGLIVASIKTNPTNVLPILRQSIMRLLAKESTFQSSNSMWSAGTASRDFRGLIPLIVRAIESEPDKGAKCRKLIRDRIDSDTTQSVARGLLLVLAINDGQTNTFIERQVDQLKQLDAKPSIQPLPYQFWWQIGQCLEDGSYPLQAITAIQQALARGQQSRLLASQNLHQPSLSANAASPVRVASNDCMTLNVKLADLRIAVGMIANARQGILNSYQQSKQIYRSYPTQQPMVVLDQFRVRMSYVKRLQTLDGVIDAIQICVETLSDKPLFDALKRQRSATNYTKYFEYELQECLAMIDTKSSGAFLSGDRNDKKQPELLALPPSEPCLPLRTSVAALLLSKIGDQPDAVANLQSWDNLYHSKIINEGLHGVAPAVVGLRALVQLELVNQGEDNGETIAALRDLQKIIPALASQPPAKDASTADNHARQRLELYSPTVIAMDSSDPQIAAIAGDIAAALMKLANEQNRNDIAHALLIGRLRMANPKHLPTASSTTLLRMLDSIKKKSDTTERSSTNIADSCLEVAQVAAKNELWEVTFAAIQRGFASGTPQRIISYTPAAKKEHAIRRSFSPHRQLALSGSQLVAVSPKPVSVGSLHHRLNALLADYRRQGDGQADAAAYTALRATVLPFSSNGSILPYSASLIEPSAKLVSKDDDQTAAQFAKPTLSGVSASDELARLAVKTDQTEALTQLLKQRRSVAPYVADLIIAQIAIHSRDDDAITKSIDRLTQPFLGYIGDKANSAARFRSLIEMGEPKGLVDSALQVSLAMHQQESLSPAAKRSLHNLDHHLLAVAAKDPSVATPTALWTWIANDLLTNANLSDADATQVNQFAEAITNRRLAPNKVQAR